jgi:hypothetical protein
LNDDPVAVTVAANEQEAAMICGYLNSRGIEATYDKGGNAGPFGLPSGITGDAFGGRQEILVRAEDLEAAKAALAERPA